MHGRLKVRTSEEEALRKKKEQEQKAKAYRAAMTKIIAKKTAEEFDTELVDMCSKILQSIPDISTLWNIKRQCIEKLSVEEKDQALFDRELGFTETCLLVNPKSYGAWHHRCWVLENSPSPNWQREVDVCTKYLKMDERNFHCWDYRRYVVANAEVSAEKEFQFCTEKIQNNFSNYSSWFYRSQLLPILYPNHQKFHSPISENQLKEELELVLTAAFTDPNDSSAWFYQRWLLGYSEQDFDVVACRIEKSKIILAFSKSVNLDEDGLKIEPNGEWKAHSGGKYDNIWTLDGQTSQLSEISVCKNDEIYKLNLKKVAENLLIGFHEPKFGYEFGKAIVDVLESQLESCNQLLEFEPDSKWTLLTASLLMKTIDRKKFHSNILENLEKLQKVDPKRCGYYRDLVSKWSIENRLDQWILAGKWDEKLDLSAINLTSIYYEQYLSVVDTIDLSQNCLSDRNVPKLEALVSCKDLNLAGNNLKKIQKFPKLENLFSLNITENPIDEKSVKIIRQIYSNIEGLKI